jgi:putative endopeptidase
VNLRTTLALLLTLSLSVPVMARGAIAFEGSDTSIRPQDDLFRHANGAWLDSTEIPADRRSYGTFSLLAERAEADVKALLEATAANPGTSPEGRMIGDFYASLMDLPALDRTGLAPLQPELDRISKARKLSDVAALIGHLLGAGVGGPIVAYVSADAKNPGMNAVTWTQSGLGLPDRDYYLKADSKTYRDAYVAYLTELGKLARLEAPAAAAKKVLAFETELAKIQWAMADRRDALKTYNPTPRNRWAKDYGPFPWEAFAKASGMPPESGAIISETTYFKAFAKLAAKTPLETWKHYLRFRLLDAYAEHLGQGFRTAYHRFHGQTLSGLKAEAPRWRTAVETTSYALGEAIGQRYVAEHFPPAAKARMQELVSNLFVAYRESLTSLEWMTPETRQAALAKLSSFKVKIGYPDKWRGYEGMVVKRGDAVGNLLNASRFLYRRDMAEAGKPVDRSRWHMTPQTVNAYYDPTANEIVFPAAILQPPFFDMAGDDAYNYGAIGAVIGHEISHGFDDEGRRFDGEGRLRDWWTPADEKAFLERAQRLIAQYDGYEALPGKFVNGKLTLGENIADLAGVAMALKAYHHSLGGKPAPEIEGMSGDQRFFMGYARVWRNKDREERALAKLSTDPHSPAAFRVNGVVTNVDSFYQVFDVKAGDKLYRKPEDRVRIW